MKTDFKQRKQSSLNLYLTLPNIHMNAHITMLNKFLKTIFIKTKIPDQHLAKHLHFSILSESKQYPNILRNRRKKKHKSKYVNAYFLKNFMENKNYKTIFSIFFTFFLNRKIFTIYQSPFIPPLTLPSKEKRIYFAAYQFYCLMNITIVLKLIFVIDAFQEYNSHLQDITSQNMINKLKCYIVTMLHVTKMLQVINQET